MESTFSQQHLVELGFRGFEILRSLPRGCAHLPAGSGIYVVLADPSATHGFLERSVGGRFKRQDGTVAINALADKWHDDIATLYIGRSRNIRRRVDEFARYGRGEPIGHRGGRYLWQLAEHDRLRIAWRLDGDPARAESDLLDDFEAAFGHYPSPTWCAACAERRERARGPAGQVSVGGSAPAPSPSYEHRVVDLHATT